MCSGGDAPSYEAPKIPEVAPTPTPVQSADVDAEKSAGKKKEKKTGVRANSLSQDRSTILGSALEQQGRDKLG